LYNPKQKENREESASGPKERNKKILLAPKPVDPLKSSIGEKAVQKGWICTISASRSGSLEPSIGKPPIA
jgi:hypothetical protein